MPDQGDLPEALQFVRLLWRLDHAINKRSRQLLRQVGVTGPQRFLLKVAGMRPGCTPGQMARFLHVTPATVTRTVQRMEAAGYLRREADPHDSRRVRLHLTPKGRRVEERCSGPADNPVTILVESTPRARVQETRQFLTDIVEALERG